MTWSIGDPVRSRVSDFAGYIKDVRGGPDGPFYIVTAPGTPGASETFRADDLEPGDPAPDYRIGAKVHLHGGLGEVTARNGDQYTVRVKRHRKSFTFDHVYHVPGWRLHIGGGS